MASLKKNGRKKNPPPSKSRAGARVVGARAPVQVGASYLAAPQGTYVQPFQFEQAADIMGAVFSGGEPALDGCWLNLAVTFARHGAPKDAEWEIWPQEAQVRLVRGSDNGRQVALGAFRAPPTHRIRPAFNSNKSESETVTFRRRFTPLEMTAIESFRGEEDLRFQVNVFGFGRRGQESKWDYFRQYDARIPRSEWMDTLARMHYLDHVHVAFPVDGDPRVEAGAQYLRTALAHRVRNDYAAVAQTCRKALEEIGTAGFGKKSPKEVKDFFHHQDPRNYSLDERTAIMRMAAMLLVHAGAHAGEDERSWTRADAELALAVTAALLQVAPTRLKNAELAEAAKTEAKE